MGLEQIVDIQISLSSVNLSRPGFGIPLIMSAAAWIPAGETRRYTTLAGILEESGVTTSSPAYLQAKAFFDQSPRVSEVVIAPTSTPVAQINTITPDVTDQEVQSFIVTLNGEEFEFVSDASPTAGEVVTGLISLINGGQDKVTASGTTTLILTADVAGEGFTVAVSANLTDVATTPSNGIGDDILKALASGADFYGVVIQSRTKAQILQAASVVESAEKLLFVCTSDADVKNGVAANVLLELEALGYNRTVLLFSEDQASFPEARWMGDTFPLDPGAVNFKFRTPIGMVADKLTDTQKLTNILGNKGNTYTVVGGQAITEEGKVVSGEWIDVIRDVDWLKTNMQLDMYELFLQSDKLPFTDAGGTVIETKLKARLEEAVSRGILSEYTLFIPKVKDIPAQDRTNRFFTGITFDGVLQGAINKVRIRGTVGAV